MAAHLQALAARSSSSGAAPGLREAVRAAEAELFEKHAAALIGNQSLDFKKQDGNQRIARSHRASKHVCRFFTNPCVAQA